MYSGFTTAKCPKKKPSTFQVEFEGRQGEIGGKALAHLPQVTTIYAHSNTVWQAISGVMNSSSKPGCAI